jgi:hypothetical protein
MSDLITQKRDVSELIAAIHDNLQSNPEDRPLREKLVIQLGQVGKDLTPEQQQEALRELEARSSEDDAVEVRKSARQGLKLIWEEGWLNRRHTTLEGVLNTLKNSEDMQVRQVAAGWIAGKSAEIAQDNRSVAPVRDTLNWMANEDQDLHLRRDALDASRKILESSWDAEGEHDGDKFEFAIFRSFLRLLGEDEEEQEDWEIRKEAADWLGERAGDIAQNERMVNDAVNTLIIRSREDEIDDVQRSAVEAIQRIWDKGWDLEDNQEARRFAILSQVNRALESGDCDLQLAAAKWLRRNAASIARRERMVGRALGELTKIANDKEQDSDVRLEAREACQELWKTSWATPENQETVLDHVLYALNGQDDPEDAEFRHIATEWLGENAGGIVSNDRMVSKALDALITRANNDPDQYTRRSAEESIVEIWDAGWQIAEGRDARHLIIVDQVMDGLNSSGTQGSHTKKAAVDWLGKKAEDIVQDNRLFHDVLDALVESLDDEGDPVRPKGMDTMRKIWDKAWDPPEQVIERGSVLNQVFKTLKKEDTDTSDYRKIREAAAEWLEEKAQDIVRNERMLNDTLNVLFNKASPEERPNVRRTAKEASRKIWNAAWETSGGARGARDALRRIQANDPEEREALRLAVFNQVLNALEKSPAQDFREQAANWLSDKAGYLAESNRMVRDSLKALRKWVVPREEADMMRSARATSRKIWNAGWKTQRQAVYEQVLKVIQDRRSRRNGWEFTQAAINFLVDKTGELVDDYDMAEKVADALYEIRNDSSLRDDLVESANRAMFAFWDALHKQYPLEALKRQFVNEDENEKIRTIRKLSNENTLGSREGVNFLVETWVQWIYQEQEPRLVELTTLRIRANEHAVLSLVEQFVKNWEEGQPKVPRGLLAALPGRSSQAKAADGEPDHARRLHVRRRIARQLADMSDPRFFEQDQAHIYGEILQELKDHAVPVLVRRLPEEKDVEILEDIARALLYTQEREAIDALWLKK